MQTNRDKEYDSFGPWLLHIDDESVLPKRFVNHVDMTITYEFMVKVPTNKDRKDLRPGLDMYDAVIGLKDDYLYVYEREDTRVKASVVNVSEVTSMVVHEDLLQGQLYLCLEDNEFVFKYNTISNDIVEDLVNRIRLKYMTGTLEYNLDYLKEDEVKTLEYYYKNEWPALKRRYPSLKILSLQGVKKLYYPNMNVAKKLANYLKRSHMKSCLYMTNGQELILSKKGKDFGKSRKTDYSTSYTFIPFERIKGIEIEEDTVTEEIKYLVVHTGAKGYKFVFHKENKWMDHLYHNLRTVCD